MAGMINNIHHYSIYLLLAKTLRDWRVSEVGLINDNLGTKRIRVTISIDK